MNLKLLSIVILLSFASIANAQWYEGEGDDRRAVPDTEWSASAGDLGAMLLITDNPEEFFEQWNRAPSPDYKPAMTTVSKVKRGTVVMAVVLFSGCGANREGNCNSQVDFTIKNPDGSLYAEHKNGELWSNKPAIPLGSLQASIDNLAFEIESDDQLGEYLIGVTVRDIVTGKRVELTRKIFVEDSAEAGT